VFWAAILWLVVSVCTPWAAGGAAEGPEGFLLPGVDVSDIDLRVGAWCRYVVVDEALGEVDSSSFYIAVLERRNTPSGEAFWLEIETGPLGAGAVDREVTRALVSGGIRDFAHGDSLYHYVYEMYIKKGAEPVRPADPDDLKRLTLAHPTSETQWIRQPGVTANTAMGDIVCNLRELTVEDSREIPTGNVRLIRHKRDHFRVWTSERIPVLGLVKCVIERSRESRTVPPVPGIPDTGARETRTTAVVVDYGDDARPLISVP
jgi:hypothetical protein